TIAEELGMVFVALDPYAYQDLEFLGDYTCIPESESPDVLAIELQKKKEPLVTEKNKKIHIEWCKRMENWKEEWDRVVFSNESKYLIFKNDAHKLVWRRCDE
ncbi:10370_t:CDS:2, partial [Paraglomus brasilianum]